MHPRTIIKSLVDVSALLSVNITIRKPDNVTFRKTPTTVKTLVYNVKKNKSVLQNNNSRPGNWDRKNNQLLIIDHVQGCIREKKTICNRPAK